MASSRGARVTPRRVEKLRSLIGDRFDLICTKVVKARADPDKIYLPISSKTSSGNKIGVWKPECLRARSLFFGAYLYGFITAAYGTLWSYLAICTLQVPVGVEWLPLKLLKLGYPMVPVILYIWLDRAGISKLLFKPVPGSRWRMQTPGYIFANLKIALLVSLGPGFFLGFMGKHLILCHLVQHGFLGEAYAEICMPVAWLLGYIAWSFLRRSFYSCFENSVEKRERCRTDWGMYDRWICVPDASKSWEGWIRSGPLWTFSLIPTPRHASMRKLALASYLTCTGITACCVFAWCCTVLVGLIYQQQTGTLLLGDIEEVAPRVALLIHTEFPLLVVNTVTTPFVVFKLWRCEPDAQRRFICDSSGKDDPKVLPLHGETVKTEIEYRDGSPWAFYEADAARERAEFFDVVAAAIITYDSRMYKTICSQFATKTSDLPECARCDTPVALPSTAIKVYPRKCGCATM